MGEFIIECTLCGSSFGSEKDYDSHPCLDEDVKVPFKIKLEQGGDDEEKELENEAKEFLAQVSKSDKQNEDIYKVTVKEEPKDPSECEEEDPIGINKILEEENKPTEEGKDEGETEPMEEDSQEQEEISAEVTPMFPDKLITKVTDAVSIRNECGICRKRFFRREDFLNHTTTSHKIPRPYQCKICKKRFTQKHYVTLHMRVHTGERPYKCKLCSNTYTHKTSYTIHMRIHNGERPYMCGLCGKKCYDKSGLTSHMRSHTKETPYECEVCGRRFTHSKSLLVHRRNHTGEKPYQCQYCGKCFRHWHKHKIHIRLHTGERPYTCSVCGKGFPRNDEVKRHMRSHQGIKSFKCSICGVYCATQASITGHIDLHHAELRKKDPNAPEKTLVKNSTSGILGTKAPQPRTIYKPIVSLSRASTPVTTTLTNSLQGHVKTTSNIKVKKNLSKPENSSEGMSQAKDGEKTKVLSYKEFIELQEKLLMCKGLKIKDPKQNSNNKNSTKAGQGSVPIQKAMSPKVSLNLPGQALDNGTNGKQLMVVSGQSGQTTMIPRLFSGNKPVLATTSQPSTSATGQRLVIRQSPLVLPQSKPGTGGQQILLLSKPVQPNPVMVSQPLLLVSGGGLPGGTSQCMVLMPSVPAANTGTGTIQTILIPASSVNTQTNNKVVVKQEPGETSTIPPPVKIAPKVTIKEEPGVSLPGGVIIKQEPVDDTLDSNSQTTSDSCAFPNVVIKQEPQD